MKKLGAHACTDITGFSLIGHALEMAIASHVGMVIQSAAIPIFPEAMEYAKLGLVPGGAYSNRQFFSCRVEADTSLSPLLMDILYDPQTSGGLLISLPPDQAQNLVGTLNKEAQMDAWIVGQVVEDPPGKIQIL
jgi:selenide,water dikinase